MINFSKRIFGTFKCFDLIMIFPVYECLLFNWVCRLRSKSHGRDVGFSNGNKFFQYWISGTFLLSFISFYVLWFFLGFIISFLSVRENIIWGAVLCSYWRNKVGKKGLVLEYLSRFFFLLSLFLSEWWNFLSNKYL